MIKQIQLFCLLLFAGTTFAQNIQFKGIIKDIITNEVVSHASITTADQQYGTISNDEGAFALSCPLSANKIIISHLNYTPLAITLNNQTPDGIYLLEPKQFLLDEIIVINIPINEFLEKLVKNSMAKFNAPVQLSTYYREFVKTNKSYTKFADALIDYNATRSGKKIDTELIVKQSRAVKLPTEDEDEFNVVSPLDVRKAVSRDYAFKTLELLLDGNAYKKYNFIIKSQQDKEGNTRQVIYFEPKEEVHEAIYKGSVTFEPASNRILDIDIAMAESHKKYIKERNFIVMKASLLDQVYKSSFKIVNDQYMLYFSLRDISMNIRNKKSVNENFKFRSDLIVTSYTTDVVKFNKKEKYKEKSLYENGNKYTEKFWLKNNSIVLTAEEENILKSLEDK
jgi:hypothetical protein